MANSPLESLKKASEKLSAAVHAAKEALAETVPGGPEARTAYEFDHNFIAPVAMLKGLPLRDLPRPAWMAKVVGVAARILDNLRQVKGQSEGAREKLAALVQESPFSALFQPGQPLPEAELEAGVRDALARRPAEAEIGFFQEILDLLQVSADTINAETEPSQDYFAMYNDLFQALPLPKIAKTFQTDATFSELRVAGPNPTSLCRVRTKEELIPITNEQYQAVISGDHLALALQEGRLYAVDYRGKGQALNGTYLQWQKYGFSPRALFAVPPRGVKLVPVAIQEHESSQTVVTPSDGEAWSLAKSVVNVADANYHELVCHLGRTHLVIEPFAVATPRILSESHPLRKLLAPHLEGTLFINWAAGKYLVAPNGFVDILLSGTVDADRVAAVLGTASRSFEASYLPRWLAAQGLDDASKLPHYPFRDDALLLWEAIGQWTKNYVSIYWSSEQAIKNDEELQAWSREVASFGGGRVAGFGEEGDGSLQTPGYLAGALQMIIFTASAMHAAVNFPQGDLMEYAPAMPLAGYTPLPAGSVSSKEWHEFLPPREQALNQINILHLLGSVYHTRLGAYEASAFDHREVKHALEAFQARLAEIEGEITVRNETRTPYHYLLPSQIPQSINI